MTAPRVSGSETWGRSRIVDSRQTLMSPGVGGCSTCDRTEPSTYGRDRLLELHPVGSEFSLACRQGFDPGRRPGIEPAARCVATRSAASVTREGC
jgi:hypothetical protein